MYKEYKNLRVQLPTYIAFLLTYLFIIVIGCIGNVYIILACMRNKVKQDLKTFLWEFWKWAFGYKENLKLKSFFFKFFWKQNKNFTHSCWGPPGTFWSPTSRCLTSCSACSPCPCPCWTWSTTTGPWAQDRFVKMTASLFLKKNFWHLPNSYPPCFTCFYCIVSYVSPFP